MVEVDSGVCGLCCRFMLYEYMMYEIVTRRDLDSRHVLYCNESEHNTCGTLSEASQD